MPRPENAAEKVTLARALLRSCDTTADALRFIREAMTLEGFFDGDGAYVQRGYFDGIAALIDALEPDELDQL